jgi:transposase
MRCRHRLSKLLLRHGIRFDDGRAWTDRHRAWLAGIELGRPAAQATLADACGAVDALVHRRDALQRQIVTLLPDSPWQIQIGRLRCLRGIDTLTAAGLCAEIGDFERFGRAEQLMSYVGLVPSESTTGEQRRLGAITKTGSGHARRLLVEAAWHYRKHPAIGHALHDRQDGQRAQTRQPHPPRLTNRAPYQLTERMFPSGSLNQATLTLPSVAMPRSSVLSPGRS